VDPEHTFAWRGVYRPARLVAPDQLREARREEFRRWLRLSSLVAGDAGTPRLLLPVGRIDLED
jgi:hypothetical protein